METSQAVVTPDLAEKWLADAAERNGNRKIRPDRVRAYADAMRAGEWQVTGAAVVFDAAGNLLDGQHRLAACVAAGRSFPTIVTFGIEPSAMSVIDSGMPRSMGDVLRFAGITSASMVAATIRLVIAWRDGTIAQTFAHNPKSRDRQLAFALEHEEALLWAIRLGGKLRRDVHGTSTAWAAILFELAQDDLTVEAEEWAEAIGSGANLGPRDARLALRNWTMNRASREIQVDSVVHLMTYVKAWNAWVSGTPVRNLRAWQRGTPLLTLDPLE
jgi:hypothetical protein